MAGTTRIRSLKPEFHTSPSTAKASLRARLLYQVLWNIANDFGYGETNLLVILGHAFPVSDGITIDQLQDLLREVAVAYEVVFYEARGRHYYWIPSWQKHNRKPNERSRQWHPTPDDVDTTVDLRFHPDDQPIPQSSGNFREFPGGSWGTGELGNGGAGEQGNGGGGELAVASNARTPDAFSSDGHPEPPLFCSLHPTGTQERCGPCGDARRVHDAWKRRQPAPLVGADAKGAAWQALKAMGGISAVDRKVHGWQNLGKDKQDSQGGDPIDADFSVIDHDDGSQQ